MGVETEFREVLWNIQQVKKQKLGPAFSEIGLTAGQPRVLTRLLKKDGITQKELSDICLIDSTTLSRILDKLEQMGLINRQNNPDCRRSFLVVLTQAGREKAILARNKFRLLDDVMLKGFTQQEKEQLLRQMTRVYENML